MNVNRIATFLEILAEIVYSDGSVKDKRELVLEQATHNDVTNIEEFVAWFEKDYED